MKARRFYEILFETDTMMELSFVERELFTHTPLYEMLNLH